MSRTSSRHSDIKSQAKKVLAIDTMRGYVIDSENEGDPLQLSKFDSFSCGEGAKLVENAKLIEKIEHYLRYVKGYRYMFYDCIVICCNDQLLKIEIEIKIIGSKIFENSEIYILGSRAPLFTHWFSKLNLKPNFGEIVAISRIKYIDSNDKQGMVCGLFTRYKADGDKEYLAQIDGINTEKNDFYELKAKIEKELPKYSSRPSSIKIIYVAVYPNGFQFEEDKSKPKLVSSNHFSHQDTDRAKGALEFGKNKINDNLEYFIEIKEQQDSSIKVIKESPLSSSVRSLTTTKSTVIQNGHLQVYQHHQKEKFVVGIDIGTTSCRAAVLYKNGNGKEMCEKVSLKGMNDKMPSMVNFDENQTFKGCEVQGKNNGDAKISEMNTVFDIIHFMGKSIGEINNHSFLPFTVEENRDFVKIKLHLAAILPEVACGELLKFIAQEVDEKLKNKMTHVTLTTPVFNDQDSKSRFETALKCAAQLASLKIVEFIDAPTATLIDFIFKYKKSAISNFNICVIDIGGGSADIVAYNVETDLEGFCLKPILKYGNSKFCGRNFDIALAEIIEKAIKDKKGYSVNIGSKYAILSRAEQMKIKLSTESSANYISDNGTTTISIKEFEKCILPLLDNFKTDLIKINSRMEEKGSQNSEVLIIGSTCKIPILSKTIKNAFPNSNIIEALFYGTSISFAQGATLHTAKIQKSNDQISFYKY